MFARLFRILIAFCLFARVVLFYNILLSGLKRMRHYTNFVRLHCVHYINKLVYLALVGILQFRERIQLKLVGKIAANTRPEPAIMTEYFGQKLRIAFRELNWIRLHWAVQFQKIGCS